MAGSIGIQPGYVFTNQDREWSSLGSEASSSRQTKNALKIARKPAPDPKAVKEERSWWEQLLFGGKSPITLTGCGYGLEKALDKPRDAGTVDGDTDGGDIVPDGDDGVPDADGDEEPNVCDNYPGAFGLDIPSNGSTGVSLTPILRWTASDPIDPGDRIVSYTVMITRADDRDFDNAITYPAFEETELTLPAPLENGIEYIWKVIATDLCDKTTESPVSSFTTVEYCETLPNTFSLISPVDGSPNESVTPTFNCQKSGDPDSDDPVTYRLEIAEENDTDFLNPIRTINGITEAEIPYTLGAEHTLDFNKTHIWRMIAVDGCGNEVPSNEAYYSFTTIEYCALPPNAFSLISPVDGSPNESVTPTFNCQKSGDPDSDDPVTYRLEIAEENDTDFLNPIRTINGITEAEIPYTLGAEHTLDFNKTHIWRMIAVDGCGNEVPSNEAYWGFTTEAGCIPQTYSETDFLSGTPSPEVVVNSGTITLARDQSAWTCWDGSVLPETVGWTENAPLGWTTKDASGGILHLSSIDLNTNARYEIDPSFSGSGWMLKTRMQLANNQGPNGCGIDVRDGSHSVFLRIQNAMIDEENSGEFYFMNPTADYYAYRIIKEGSTFSVYVDDILRLNGTASVDVAPSHLWFHDIGGSFDSEAYWDYLCYYNGGSSLPYVSSGTYTSDIVDTLSFNNNIGSGAMLHWSQNTPPGTSIEMQFCASDDAGLAGATCADGLINNAGEIIPGLVSGKYFQWTATLKPDIAFEETPELFDVTLNYETCD